MKTKYYDVSISITRILAFISIPCIHFFLYSGFYAQELVGSKMIIFMCLRTLCRGIGVPTFLILTGYLNSAKRILITKDELRKYYYKIRRVLITYVLSMVAIWLYILLYKREPVNAWGGYLTL